MGGSRVDEGVSKLGELTRLELLDLSGTKVGDAGLAGLKGLARLRSLDLKGTGVTEDWPTSRASPARGST
ncbi:MAG: leucine-rich repeat domain-containing protein [Singulisphaera sp.]